MCNSTRAVLISTAAFSFISACVELPTEEDRTPQVRIVSREPFVESNVFTTLQRGQVGTDIVGAEMYWANRNRINTRKVSGSVDRITGRLTVQGERIGRNDAYVYEGYNYVIYYADSTPSPGIFGVVGFPSESTDIPLSGTATYRGGAFGEAAQFSANGSEVERVYRAGGSSLIEADFGSGSVDVTIDFSNAENGLIDVLRVNDMNISGNTFENGNIMATVGGERFNFETAFGTINTERSYGTFYGLPGSRPAEVGGGVSVQGTRGYANALFFGN